MEIVSAAGEHAVRALGPVAFAISQDGSLQEGVSVLVALGRWEGKPGRAG